MNEPWDMLDQFIAEAADYNPPLPKREAIQPKRPPTPQAWRGVKLKQKLRRNAGGECMLIGFGYTHATVRFPTGKRYRLEVETLYRCYTPV